MYVRGVRTGRVAKNGEGGGKSGGLHWASEALVGRPTITIKESYKGLARMRLAVFAFFKDCLN